jgi:hypothetical protein
MIKVVVVAYECYICFEMFAGSDWHLPYSGHCLQCVSPAVMFFLSAVSSHCLPKKKMPHLSGSSVILHVAMLVVLESCGECTLWNIGRKILFAIGRHHYDCST